MGIGIAIPILFLHNSICFKYRPVRDLDMTPFWIALQFLTVLPIELKTIPTAQQNGRAILFYPLVGLIIGAYFSCYLYFC